MDLWESQQYQDYMHTILMANGPPGAYHVTCKKCHMDTSNEATLVCECQGLDGSYLESTLDDAVACQSIENINGFLHCGDARL